MQGELVLGQWPSPMQPEAEAQVDQQMLSLLSPTKFPWDFSVTLGRLPPVDEESLCPGGFCPKPQDHFPGAGQKCWDLTLGTSPQSQELCINIPAPPPVSGMILGFLLHFVRWEKLQAIFVFDFLKQVLVVSIENVLFCHLKINLLAISVNFSFLLNPSTTTAPLAQHPLPATPQQLAIYGYFESDFQFLQCTAGESKLNFFPFFP